MVIIKKILRDVGRNTLGLIGKMGNFFIFVSKVVVSVFVPRWYPKQIMYQIFHIGYLSLPVVGLTAIFTGGVIALQTYTGAARYSVTDTVPFIVVLTITRELGPVLTALMVAGRISSSIAAEIATMRVTEQIDALKTLSTDPYRYLIAPRVISGLICLPFLTMVADIIGIMGGYLTSIYSLGFSEYAYLKKTWDFLKMEDVVHGLIKSVVFGFIITLLGCFCGYNSDKGAAGVGKATTNAVVAASILILLFNYLMTELFFI